MTATLPWAGTEHHCFGCSPDNPSGLRLEFTDDGDTLSAEFELDHHYESYPGVVHGGILAVICDETMGNLIVLRLGVPALTTSMRTRYVGVVRVGQPYRCVARAVTGGELVRASAEILDAHGEIVGTATATYKPQRSAA
ncbi:PaaI family thioesterase [Amycolatopsis acidicola]|uniref:Acyl-coenzyme A thioesterase THEM4 n=1 Tax=Amycolatopsis acidicola TaxID=2596893 RepID=A0A5N0UT60_9PSEU|nr:PaaI family thioesterase [Amycolatopsis acidicola]KAA9151248.1 PaaI family thioesterase [Amycolatopsis acidicola]